MASIKNEMTGSGRKLVANQGNYAVHVFVLLLALAAAIYGGNILAVQAAADYKQQVEEIKNKYNQAVATNQQLEQKVQRSQMEMKSIESKADLWKKSESKINKPFSQNAVEWISMNARNQKPSVSINNNTSAQANPTTKAESVQIGASGEFGSLLSWMMQSEHELDVVRVVGAEWKAKTPKIVELTLNIEVDSNE